MEVVAMSDKTLSFTDLVRPDLMIHDLLASDREDALRQMSQLLVDRGYCFTSFVEGILTRERHHPSALPMEGHKIAIPHTDAEHVKESTILFARLTRPVEFISMGSMDDRIEVQMISMFALKEKKLIGDLLETLITVYQHDEILDALLNSRDSGEMYGILLAGVERFGK
jgi:PTS system galactitol-specific IIA component